MSKPTTLSERKFIEKKAEEGWKSQQIADEMNLSLGVVRKWRQRLKKGVELNQKWEGHSLVHSLHILNL